MGKALKALKTWLELSAEHLEQSNDLDIVLLSYPIVFPLPPATRWPKSLLKRTVYCSHINTGKCPRALERLG